MTIEIEKEIENFDSQCSLLLQFIEELALVDKIDIGQRHWFLAEAVFFRLYRVYERLIRHSFLFYCVNNKTITGGIVSSKLVCPSIDHAESILKSGNKFLDWGNVESTRKMANLIFENGFPIVDIISPIASKLTDLQRFRNFIAHDSADAAAGFKKSRTQYVKLGDVAPQTVGQLSLYRKKPAADITLKILYRDVSSLGLISRTL